jgi:Ca2+-binding EF-hand superfamily protein
VYEKFEANLEAAKGDDAKTHALCEGLFNAIDAYADGNISKDELIAFEVSKGVDQAKAEQAAALVFKKIDADGNEKIDLNELKNAMVAYQNGH